MTETIDMNMGAHIPGDIFAIAELIRETKEWPKKKQKECWNKTVEFFLKRDGELPLDLQLATNRKFMTDLAYDRGFAEMATIPYHRFDEYWNAVRAAFAVYAKR